MGLGGANSCFDVDGLGEGKLGGDDGDGNGDGNVYWWWVVERIVEGE